jgi:hypothetical protein
VYAPNASAFVGCSALFVAALFLEWIKAPGIVLKKWGDRRWVARCRFGLIIDRIRGLGFNLLWLIPPFPLPIWIAFTVSVGAWLKYTLVTLPFRRMTNL